MATLVHLADHLHGLEIDDLIDVMTFLAVEKTIASGLRERVRATAATINADEVRSIATRRQDGHWASPGVAGAPEVPRKALHAVYDALMAAADFFALRNQNGPDFDFPDAPAMYRAYESSLFRFDQLYRHFCEAADQAESSGWDILKPLRADLEACYTNWFVPKLALAWAGSSTPRGRPACWRSGASSGSRTSTSSSTGMSSPASRRPRTAGSTWLYGVTISTVTSGPVPCQNLIRNLHRNQIVGPGLFDMDFSIFKNIKLTERITTQFRVEMFNVLNHPSFLPPLNREAVLNTNGTPVSRAGLIDTTADDPRQIQFGLKLNF